MNKIIVSVIIPVFNGGLFIEKAIDSALYQNVSLEIIIINDCSLDNTEEIIKKYLWLPNIIYIKNRKQLGVSESRNLGVKMARGSYIAFLDADDWWRKDKLIQQINLLEKTGACICYTSRILVKNNGTVTKRIINVKETVNYNILLKHNQIVCSSVLLPKRVALEMPMGTDCIHEDYLNWLQILKSNNFGCGLNEPYVFYRMTNKSKSRNKLKSIKMTYGVYRQLRISKIKSLSYTLSHLIISTYKYTISIFNYYYKGSDYEV